MPPLYRIKRFQFIPLLCVSFLFWSFFFCAKWVVNQVHPKISGIPPCQQIRAPPFHRTVRFSDNRRCTGNMNLGTGAVKITPAQSQRLHAAHATIAFICLLRGGLSMRKAARCSRHDAVRCVLPSKKAHKTGTDSREGKTANGMVLIVGLVFYGFPIRCDCISHLLCLSSFIRGFLSGYHREMIMPQWFIDVTDMARRSVEAVEKGELKILPEFHVKTWNQVSDWYISK